MTDADFLTALGERVRVARLRHGWSQERLAELCGLDRTYVGGIERGERNLSALKIKALSEQLGIEPAALLP